MKFTCPNCGETISTAGRVCALCGFDKRQAAREAEKEIPFKALSGGAFLGAAIGFLAAMGSGTSPLLGMGIAVPIMAALSLLFSLDESDGARKPPRKKPKAAAWRQSKPSMDSKRLNDDDVMDWLGKPSAPEEKADK